MVDPRGDRCVGITRTIAASKKEMHVVLLLGMTLFLPFFRLSSFTANRPQLVLDNPGKVQS